MEDFRTVFHAIVIKSKCEWVNKHNYWYFSEIFKLSADFKVNYFNWIQLKLYTVWKLSKYGVFSGLYFPAFGPAKKNV